jgi:hypothetical protein
MKKVFLVLVLCIIISSCTDSKYEYIGQEIIDGKISAVEKGGIGRWGYLPKIWVQTPTETRAVEIPFEYQNRWKVGDSCLLIIEKYKEKSQNK